MAPSCLINTYKDVHASKEGLTTSKVKKEIPPPWPPKLGHCAGPGPHSGQAGGC